MSNFDLELLKEIGELLKKYLPSRFQAFYLVNCPLLVNGLYHLVKPLITSDYKKLIHFLREPEELLRVIDKEYLPQRYGGTLMLDDTWKHQAINELTHAFGKDVWQCREQS